MNIENASKTLAFMLRHSRDPMYVRLDGGWADVDRVIEMLKLTYPDMNRDYLDQIVASDKKGRYSYDMERRYIRANQGHSIPGVMVEMRQAEPPEFLYHGTAARFLDSIMQEGLKPMSRQYVHISSSLETAISVGKRHGDPVVLLVHSGEMVKNGFQFYCSVNGVWQTKEIPVEYLSVVKM